MNAETGEFSSESSNKGRANETQGIPLGFTFEVYKNSRQRKKIMKLVIQRVNHASVTVEGKVTGEIKKVILFFLALDKATMSQWWNAM